jgi:DNA-binding MarR family transcriptional regulator
MGMEDERQEAVASLSPDDLSERVRTLARAFGSFTATVARILALTPSDVMALEHLFAEGPLGPADIAARLGMTTPAATALVDRLERAGHVERRPHPTDRRRLEIVPTPQAEAAAYAAIAEMIEGMADVGASLTPAERAVVARYLDGAAAVFHGFRGRR